MIQGSDVAVFRHREKQERLASYVPPLTAARVTALGKIWTGLSRFENPKASAWSESETVGRLIEAALDMAETEMGIKLADLKTDADFDRVLATVAKRLNASK